MFSDEQLTEIYHCVREVLVGRYPTDQGQEKLLEKVEEQIRDAIPNLTGKIAQLKENPALATVPAIQNDRIISVKLCEVFASSMTGDTVEKFAQAFHPDCF